MEPLHEIVNNIDNAYKQNVSLFVTSFSLATMLCLFRRKRKGNAIESRSVVVDQVFHFRAFVISIASAAVGMCLKVDGVIITTLLFGEKEHFL
jgi:hypothetical protein